MAGIIQFTGYFTDEPDVTFERELTTDGASLRVSRSGDTVTLAIDREQDEGVACLAAPLTRNQVSALVKALIEAAS